MPFFILNICSNICSKRGKVCSNICSKTVKMMKVQLCINCVKICETKKSLLHLFQLLKKVHISQLEQSWNSLWNRGGTDIYILKLYVFVLFSGFLSCLEQRNRYFIKIICKKKKREKKKIKKVRKKRYNICMCISFEKYLFLCSR